MWETDRTSVTFFGVQGEVGPSATIGPCQSIWYGVRAIEGRLFWAENMSRQSSVLSSFLSNTHTCMVANMLTAFQSSTKLVYCGAFPSSTKLFLF
jgi:hypothetical protein